MDKKLNRDKALDMTRRVFGGNASDGRQHSTRAKAFKASKTQGRQVTPEFPRSIEDDMTAKAPELKYGFSTSPNDYQQFSDPTSYRVNPELAKYLGPHTQSYYSRYGNIDFDFNMPLPDYAIREGHRHAHALRNRANNSGLNVHNLFEQFMYQNELDPLTVLSTSYHLRFGSML